MFLSCVFKMWINQPLNKSSFVCFSTKINRWTSHVKTTRPTDSPNKSFLRPGTASSISTEVDGMTPVSRHQQKMAVYYNIKIYKNLCILYIYILYDTMYRYIYIYILGLYHIIRLLYIHIYIYILRPPLSRYIAKICSSDLVAFFTKVVGKPPFWIWKSDAQNTLKITKIHQV